MVRKCWVAHDLPWDVVKGKKPAGRDIRTSTLRVEGGKGGGLDTALRQGRPRSFAHSRQLPCWAFKNPRGKQGLVRDSQQLRRPGSRVDACLDR